MSHRIPSTLVGPIPVTGPDGNTTLEYVEGPTLWQRIAFEWEYSGIIGRIGWVLLVIAASPLLALGMLASLVALFA
jgi:hypothetical protein